MPEITTITSESLQAEVRRLLPSQRGFGQDLEAQNVIVPIVDLTPTAEGSALRQDLQTASSYGSINNATRVTPGESTIVQTPGFYKYHAEMAILTDNTAGTFQCLLKLRDSTNVAKLLHVLYQNADASGQEPQTISVNGIVFLQTGDKFQAETIGADAYIHCSAWQIASVNGDFVNPSGFSFE
jgi:hypothetical protein